METQDDKHGFGQTEPPQPTLKQWPALLQNVHSLEDYLQDELIDRTIVNVRVIEQALHLELDNGKIYIIAHYTLRGNHPPLTASRWGDYHDRSLEAA